MEFGMKQKVGLMDFVGWDETNTVNIAWPLMFKSANTVGALPVYDEVC